MSQSVLQEVSTFTSCTDKKKFLILGDTRDLSVHFCQIDKISAMDGRLHTGINHTVSVSLTLCVFCRSHADQCAIQLIQ